MTDPLKGKFLGAPTEQEWRDAKAALVMAETMAAAAVSFIEAVAAGGEWEAPAYSLNDKIYNFRKANLS